MGILLLALQREKHQGYYCDDFFVLEAVTSIRTCQGSEGTNGPDQPHLGPFPTLPQGPISAQMGPPVYVFVML